MAFKLGYDNAVDLSQQRSDKFLYPAGVSSHHKCKFENISIDVPSCFIFCHFPRLFTSPVAI